jgi:hypothetical protein
MIHMILDIYPLKLKAHVYTEKPIVNVYGSFIQNRKKLEAGKVFFDR